MDYWKISWVQPEKLVDCFGSWKCPMKNLEAITLWKFSFPHLCWDLWKERNNIIFRDKDSPSWVVGQKNIKAIKKNFLAQNGGKGDFNISNPIINSSMKDMSKREGAVWMSPSMGWLKAKFDGAAKGNPTSFWSL